MRLKDRVKELERVRDAQVGTGKEWAKWKDVIDARTTIGRGWYDSPYQLFGSFSRQYTVSEVIELILEHLGLDLEDIKEVPKKTVLKKKPAKKVKK